MVNHFLLMYVTKLCNKNEIGIGFLKTVVLLASVHRFMGRSSFFKKTKQKNESYGGATMCHIDIQIGKL